MTTPPTDPNVRTDVTPVKAAKPGIPRAALLGGTVLLVGGVAAAAFFLMPKGNDETPVDTPPAPTQVAQQSTPPTTTPRPVASATPDAVAKAKQQARAAMNDNVDLRTSFDNVPVALGGTGGRRFPDTPGTAATTAPAPGASPVAGSKDFLPIKQGTLPSASRTDPFVSRLVVPILRGYGYTLAIPIRLAPPPKPVIPQSADIPAVLRLGPLVFPGRVAGFLEYGGVSAILETGVGTGAFEIVQPGSQVSSGIPGVAPLTVESISNTELILRSEDGRTARVPLSGVPGGLFPGGQGAPGVPGGAPPGVPGADPRSGPQGAGGV